MINQHKIDSENKKRKANVVSVLIPAKSYRIQCSWTRDRPLPAIEDFACRLLLLFGELTSSELQSFFGLSSREREVLIEALTEKRLITLNEKGILVPTPLLAVQANSGDSFTKLTEYEERSELAIFDLLTGSLIPRKSLDKSRFGLPELEINSEWKLEKEDVISRFSYQYRAHLEYTRSNVREAQSTRLYKVSSCEVDKTLQIPVDIDIYVAPSNELDPRVFRDAVEKIGSLRRRALSNELETCVADYFAGLSVSNNGLSFEDYCELVDDSVLSGFIKEGSFDFSSWLKAREQKLTGYGTQETVAILGPVYLDENRKKVLRILRDLRRSQDEEEPYQALWLSSEVPLWGASGEELAEFTRKLEVALSEYGGEKKGCLTTFFQSGEERRVQNEIKNKFYNKISNAVDITGSSVLNRLELFVVPGKMAIAQYHVQPDPDSGVTVPIGYITVESSRVERLTNLLEGKLMTAEGLSVLWSRDSKQVDDLLGMDISNSLKYLFEEKKTAQEKNISARKSKEVPIQIKNKRKKLNLKGKE